MDMKQSIELAVFVIASIALVAALLNVLMRERRQTVGYNDSGGGDWNSGSSGTSSDPGPSSGSHGCSHGSSSSDGGSCGGGDGGGGGGD